MHKLKSIHPESISKALDKAVRYRLLNEPWQAESICRDVLDIQPDHQNAIVNLILAITDQFPVDKNSSSPEAKEFCNRLTSEYQRLYYQGIIAERLGSTALMRTTPRAKYIAYEYYTKAMKYYDQAEKLSSDDNEESVLRWNACVRRISEFKLVPAPDEDRTQPLLDV